MVNRVYCASISVDNCSVVLYKAEMKSREYSIRLQLLNKKWTVTQLAQKLRVSRATAYNIMRGDASLKLYKKVGKLLGLDPRDLVFPKGK